ncbi:hypothetical protein MGG_00418 [Pyricularia oryzae 70-15]|uniref:Uncharacterized protein n=3 Tax=Pyricularia oryzae TaxID=318829 RepID=G4NCC2_PYRO7|nr:uncharacterized protein MGG_00418 [Pyricularia oryzae 70-15]EHA49071.1 hypothetical protein MGG_00418 [Pyricularia oryzae 70-15]ELQ42614.1 hypothetical protein OOU_Y34scaffold00203g103 [Pyricularia oryzae Y34]
MAFEPIKLVTKTTLASGAARFLCPIRNVDGNLLTMQLYPLDQATAPRPPVKRCLGGVLARSGNGPVPCVHEDGEAALLPRHSRRTGKGANDKGMTELEAMAPSTSTWIYLSECHG